YNKLPEPIQRQYLDAVISEADDIIDGSNSTILPHQWPAEQRDKITPILPNYKGDVAPLNWNRNPDLSKMAKN
ncbi:MAG: hypothetical protein HOM01_01640, partial [Kordiimonadaceae bacterium]|nr:hypothetical protein [Kordiimonadaceae bacterium]